MSTKGRINLETKGNFSKNEWKHILCMFKINEFLDVFLLPFKKFLAKVREYIVVGAMSRVGQERTWSDGSFTAKARPVNLVMHSQCKEETSSSSLRSRVNLGTDDERKELAWHQEIGSTLIRNWKVDKRRSSEPPGNWAEESNQNKE